jgi:hypothetical protein
MPMRMTGVSAAAAGAASIAPKRITLIRLRAALDQRACAMDRIIAATIVGVSGFGDSIFGRGGLHDR